MKTYEIVYLAALRGGLLKLENAKTNYSNHLSSFFIFRTPLLITACIALRAHSWKKFTVPGEGLIMLIEEQRNSTFAIHFHKWHRHETRA